MPGARATVARMWAALKVRIDCPECGEAVFIDAPHPTVHCASCRVEVELRSDGASLWPWVIHNALRSEGREGKFANDNLLNTGAVVPFVYLASHRGMLPTCSDCNAPMPELQSVAHGTTGDVSCPGCGAKHPTWPAAYKDADGDETSFQVFMAPPLGTQASPPPAAVPVKPVLFGCPNCGSNLPIGSEASRVTTCQYCDTDAYLPAEIWNRLHPVRRRRVFWIRTPDARRR